MPHIPRATYRLQFHKDFGFDAAAQLVDYLADLGVSHLYSSPVLQAVPGSAHGYDVVDHTRVSADLGGHEAYRRLRTALERRELGQLLDIVPNHMAVGTRDNALWWDVLENGPASEAASFFDVDWDAMSDNRVLLPILGEHYFDALEARLIRIERERERFLVRYHEHVLPAAPRSVASLLRNGAPSDEELNFWADALENLPAPGVTDRESTARRHRDKAIIFRQLGLLFERRSELAQSIDAALAELSDHPDQLDGWLERQNWRIAFWQNAATDLGYRRFFDVNTLAGLRVEDPRVFQRSHRMILEWLRDRTLDGVRIDHVDGLRDPHEYLQRLRSAAPDAYIVVEKILMGDECLPSAWPVEGTTGYEFARWLDQVFVDPAGEQPMTELAARYGDQTEPWDEQVRSAKLLILSEVLTSERDRLTDLAYGMFRRRIELRDCTRHSVQRAMSELLVSYPVYRSYARERAATTEQDLELLKQVIARASEHEPEVEPRMWTQIERALRLELEDPATHEFALRVQQVTGAITAKAIEDTLFYRYSRLTALNEVGGTPEQFGVSLEAFHHAMTACKRPHTMLASSTHDTKRGEDMRARLLVLSEIPGEWRDAVERWSARASRWRDSNVDARTEYFFYQTLVGAYPLSAERALQYMQKALREAKLRTSWIRPDADYEAAVERFIRGVLDDRELIGDVSGFVARIAPLGYLNGLARTLIKLTAPGVPDLYQGTELWDLSLVDPDNRRPVDFEARRKLLARLPGLGPAAVLAELEQGTPKLWVTWKALGVRRRRPELSEGEYAALPVDGADASSVIAFRRNATIATIVPRFFARGDVRTRKATVKLAMGTWRNVLTDQRIVVSEAGTPVSELWDQFPMALLERES
jgi:(1->4)-alpha-D-glucan 1-alpha-D-glucosylmutase